MMSRKYLNSGKLASQSFRALEQTLVVEEEDPQEHLNNLEVEEEVQRHLILIQDNNI